jgi:cell division protease FtsH
MNESAIIAAKKDKHKINMVDITEGINKVLLGPQKRSRVITDEDKKITAYHEAGHAVISRLLEKDQVVQEVSIIPRGMAGGYTLTNEKDNESQYRSRKHLNSRLAMLMGGRCAEELFIGDISTGSQNDLKHATGIAEKMVTNFGMSDKLGPVFHGKEEEIALRMYNDKKVSESMQSLIDGEVKAFIINAEKTCKELLKANSSKMHVMANVLVERETIYAEDVTLIMEGKTEKQVIAAMEKREQEAKEKEKQARIDADLTALASAREHSLQHAKAYLDAKLTTEANIERLKANYDLAAEFIKNGGELEYLPTLDNLDVYASLLDKPKEQEPKAEKAKDEVKEPKQPRTKTKVKETKTNNEDK